MVPCPCIDKGKMFAGQVGVNDFIVKNIGRITDAVFHPDAQKKRVFVTTVCASFQSPHPILANPLDLSRFYSFE
jgi:hypothetical protein